MGVRETRDCRNFGGKPKKLIKRKREHKSKR